MGTSRREAVLEGLFGRRPSVGHVMFTLTHVDATGTWVIGS